MFSILFRSHEPLSRHQSDPIKSSGLTAHVQDHDQLMRHHSDPPSGCQGNRSHGYHSDYEIDVDSMTVSLSRTNLFQSKHYQPGHTHSRGGSLPDPLGQARSRSGSGKMCGILEEHDPFAYESDSVFSEDMTSGSDYPKYRRNTGDQMGELTRNVPNGLFHFLIRPPLWMMSEIQLDFF